MSDRWPMTRGELATRLSKALEDVKIAVRDPENSGSVQGSPDGWKHLWSMGVAFYPSDTAERLLDDIDAQDSPADGSRVREMTCPNCDAVAVGQPGDHCPACGYVVTGEPGRGGLPKVNPGNAVDEALQRCRAALSWCSPDNRQRVVGALVGDVIKTGTPRILTPEPDDGVPPDLTAAATIIRELEALSGTSGAGWDHMTNVLRFAAGHFGYEIAEQDT